jgi:hypothetical protein
MEPLDAMAKELRQTDSWKRLVSVGMEMWPITACSRAGREESSCENEVGMVGGMDVCEG